MKRWKHLRDAFVRSQKREKSFKSSGSQAPKLRKYIFNDELKFLQKVYEKRETDESFVISNEHVNTEKAIESTSPQEGTAVDGETEAVSSKAK